MKRSLLFIGIILFVINCFADDAIHDLESKLKEVSGKEKIDILIKLSNQYKKISSKKSIYYGKEAIELSRKIYEPQQEAFALYNLATIYKEFGNYEKSLEYLHASLEIDDERLENIITESLLEYAKMYSSAGYNEKAEEYYKKYTTKKDTLILDLQKRIQDEKKNKNINISRKNRKIYDLEKNEKIKKDEIDELEKNKAIQELKIKHAKYETEKKRREIILLERDKAINELEITKQKNIKRLFFIVSILVLMLAFMLYNRYRSNLRSHKRLEKAHSKIIQMNKKLNEIARIDPLTKLSNRRDIIEKIEHEKKRFERNKKPFVLVMCDIDDFKSVNDRYGHDCGDYVLVLVSATMKKMIRKQDTVGRWGGEEFLFLLPETDLDGGKLISEKVRKRIENMKFDFNNVIIPVTLTFGVSVFNELINIDLCIKKADQALYVGKESGKNCVILENINDNI